MNTISVVSPVAQATAQVAGVDSSKLVDARRGYIAGIKTEGASLNVYAAWMCSTFNVCDAQGAIIKPWYTLSGKAAIGVKAEFKSFADDLQAAGYAPGVEYTYWARVKDASGRTKSGINVQGDPTDILVKTLAELKTMLNRINKARGDNTESSERVIEAYDDLCVAYATLGGDITKLTTV
jgi:hypothetical protein